MVNSAKDISNVEKIGKTLHFYSRLLLIEWRNLAWPFLRYKMGKPVFIVGCSRAGTTVVYKVLSMANELGSLQKESHAFWNSLHSPEENNWDSHNVDADAATDKDRAAATRFFYKYLGMNRFVDKANQNCFRIPYLKELFPDAFFVYVKRDGRDNINSLIHGWGKPNEFANWSASLPCDIQIENGKYRQWAFFLFPGWRNYLKASIEEVCAQQWIAANESVLSVCGAVSDAQWIEVFYEDILSRPIDTFKKLFKRLDVPFSNDAEEHCSNLLNSPYNAFSPPRLNKWTDENRDRIERVIPVISKTMTKMGYVIE